MDHAYIEDNQIADRYVMGTLPPEEVERFENHYLSCPECLDRLDLVEPLQRGFKRMAGQDAAKLAATRQLAFVAWLARLGRSRQIGFLLAALLLIAVLPAGLLLRGTAERGRELALARSDLEQERQRSEQSAAETARLRSKLEANQRDLASQRQQLAQAQQPQSVTVLNLDVERGASLSGGEPTHNVRLPARSGWIILSIPIDPPFQRSYVAVLWDTHGHEVKRIADLKNQSGTLSFSLPPSLLPPGDYSLTIEGLSGRFTFRVLPPA
ncbi:MAG: zf-HC2 domain-containing protein [Acidobacteria bacterium]|nr:zf-HC2 domain-containing protein [Acidobacteriota bacterium]